MKAKIIFVILIFLLLILCFYISRNNQNLGISNNKKENFQSSTENQETTPDTPQSIPLYSISVVSTPYLTYMNSLTRDSKTYVAKSHMRFNDNSKYIPIKITPLCKFDVTQDKLLFYFLIDILNDDEYDNYDYKVTEPNASLGIEKYKNLPLLSADGNKIFKYKIRTNTNFTEFMRVRTDLEFMLPHSTDPLDISSDRDINKLLDIDMKVQQIDNDMKQKIINGEDISGQETKIIIPRLINSEQISSLRSLGVSLFNFIVEPDDIEVTYKPSINYTETYQLSSDFYSYQKLNCAQISVIVRNNKYLNLENSDNKLKFKFILQSVKDSSDDELIYNTINYPNNIFNDETNFNINKDSYQLNFYISDTECHKIKTQPLQLVAYLYSDSNLSSGK